MRKYQTYIEKYRSRIVLMGFFVFLFHGAKLFSPGIGIDTEDLIHLQDDFYNGWLTTGRQGLVFLKALMGNLAFNPYLTGLLTLFLLTVGGASFFLLWECVSAGKRSEGSQGERNFAGWFFGGLLFLSHPVLTEQFYFSLQSVEICVCFLMTALALYFTDRWIRRRSVILSLVSVFLLVVTFSSYQVFVALYIFGAVTLLLVKGLEKASCAELLRQMFSHMAVFLAAFLANTVITKLFFSGSSYLQNQINWGKAAFADVARSMGGHVIKVCTGYHSIYYSAGYGLLWVFVAALFFVLLGKRGYGRKEKLLLTFFLAALFCTPFLITIVCGGAPTVRSQLVLPVMTGFLGWFAVYLIKSLDFSFSKRMAAVWCVVVILSLFTGFFQLGTTMRLYYTDRVRYEQDAALGRAVIERIEQVRGNDWLPVIFIGKREFKGNNACVEGETIGKSFFAYDVEAEPSFYWSSRRILGFFHALGQSYPLAEKEKIPEAMEYSTYMPEWPVEGSVQIHDGVIVVKLSHFK